MLRHNRITVSLLVSLFLLCGHASSQTAPSRLRYGDMMPSLAGQTLSGMWVDLPQATGGKPAVVVFSFSRAGGRDAQSWTQHLSADNPGLTIYTVIFLEGVPRFFRSMAVSGIKSEMPAAMQDKTVLLYRDEQLWKQRLQLGDERHACVALIGVHGEIRWMASDSFTDPRYSELGKMIVALK